LIARPLVCKISLVKMYL